MNESELKENVDRYNIDRKKKVLEVIYLTKNINNTISSFKLNLDQFLEKYGLIDAKIEMTLGKAENNEEAFALTLTAEVNKTDRELFNEVLEAERTKKYSF